MTKTEDQPLAIEAETSIENAPAAPETDPDGQNPPEDTGAEGADNAEAGMDPDENAARLAALEEMLNYIGAKSANGTVPDDLHDELKLREALTTEANGTVMVELMGITAGSPYGLHRALLDWCMAATRVIMSGVAPK